MLRNFAMTTLFYFAVQLTSSAFASCQFQNQRTWIGSDDAYKVAEVLNTCEISPGVWPKAGATLVWFSNGQLQRISAIGRDSQVAPGVVVLPEAYVSWHRNGQIAYVQLLKTDTQVAPGVWARHMGSFVIWYDNGNPELVEILVKDFLSAKKCQTARFYIDGSLASATNSYMWPLCD